MQDIHKDGVKFFSKMIIKESLNDRRLLKSDMFLLACLILHVNPNKLVEKLEGMKDEEMLSNINWEILQ